MKIAVKAMSIGEKTTPDYVSHTLLEFFVEKAHQFKENPKYSFTFANEGQTRECSILEGGCQFSFDRDEGAPIRCIDCKSDNCTCGKRRYALQGFLKTRVYILDVDQNGTRKRTYRGFCKYHTLTFEEEQELRKMEDRLKTLNSILFFYRTKCNGFRIGFDAGHELCSIEDYESLAKDAEDRVRECTPDKKLVLETHEGGALFHIDTIANENGVSIRSHAYWSYPRVYHPVWLNPNRIIK